MGGTQSTQVTAGIWGFLVLFGLALACYFLFRSMNTHLRRVKFAEREEQARLAQQQEKTTDVDDPIGSGHDSH